jgi:hypothetical protein
MVAGDNDVTSEREEILRLESNTQSRMVSIQLIASSGPTIYITHSLR